MSVKLQFGMVDGKKLRISVTESRTGTTFQFDNASPGDCAWAATLLFEKLNDGFSERAMAMRKAAYERGWRDAKKKDAKREWFSSCINEEGDR